MDPPSSDGDGRPASEGTPSEEEPLYVVGIGASAGGLEALEEFFDNVAPDSGLAYVVVQHLSPDFRSLMDEILARRTPMSVRQVEDGMRVEPDCVYLIPPRSELIISGGRLLLREKDPEEALALPIDRFFRSLAGHSGDRAIAVVLSGTGSDGSRGVVDVHQAGGLVLAQDPEGAQFDGMPRSACDRGVVDEIGAASELPKIISRYVDCARQIKEPASDRTEADSIGQILELLNRTYDLDFAHYKPTTIRRRIERRLMLNRSESIEEYVERLATDDAELSSLYQDLLIGVTKFFRDRGAFERIRTEVIPAIAERAPPSEEIRAWVPGCATGEEAYSIAMLFREVLEAMGRPLNVKIFATDVERRSLLFAAEGVYSDDQVSELDGERVQRHFEKTDRGLQVVAEVRRMVVFAPHNVIKDAPFTKLDLVSCRNLLIYFQPQVQKRVLSLFHFGLNKGGVLLLGPSETPGDLAPEFLPVDRHDKIFRKRRDVRLPTSLRFPTAASLPQRETSPKSRPSSQETQLLKAYEALSGRFAPPSVLVDRRGALLHTFAGGGAYLSLADGASTLNILDMVRTELRLIVHAALQRAKKTSTSVEYAGVQVEGASGVERVRVVVAPVSSDERDGPCFLISFVKDASVMAGKDGDVEPREVDMEEISRERIAALEQELQHTRENLQATLEEMETANEEIQASNEELVASNEELQSTNEELHSVNEELYTVNAEYQKKINELTELSEDMENLFAATDVATIFMDDDLTIRKFTPQVAQLFHLLPQDVGRRIGSFMHSLDLPNLVDDLEHVLRAQEPLERQVEARGGRWYLLRAIPYRARHTVDGVVLCLVDITSLKTVERQLRLMSKVFHDAADPIIIEDLSGKIVDLNRDAERAYGFSRQELLGQSTTKLVPEEHRGQNRDLRRRCIEKDHVRNVETVRVDREGRERPVLLTLSLLTDEKGAPTAIATIAKDISDLKTAEAAVRSGVRRRDEFLAILSHELRNPLAAARTAAGLLQEHGSGSPQAERAAAVVERQVGHMSRLLDDLLDVTRVMRGKIELKRSLIDVRDAARSAYEAVETLAIKRRQAFQLSVADEPLLTQGDPARVRQVFENLLVNATKYTPEGGHIDFDVRSEGPDILVRVRDDGRGIPRERLTSIFELFSQAEDSIDRSDGGIGVGLTLCRDLIQLHGGEILARSDGQGLGTTFVVRLPRVSEAELPASSKSRESTPVQQGERVLQADASTKESPTNGDGHRDGGGDVVIVEDNVDARDMLQSLLELSGWNVRIACDGASGVEEILSRPPRVALIDIGLPSLNGYEVARRIRKQLVDVRLIALTGYGGTEDRRMVREAGFDAHLVKPVSRHMLFEQLQHGRR